MLCASQTSWFPGDSGGLTNSSALGLLQPEKNIQIFLTLKFKKNSVSPVFDKLELNYSTIKYTHV